MSRAQPRCKSWGDQVGPLMVRESRKGWVLWQWRLQGFRTRGGGLQIMWKVGGQSKFWGSWVLTPWPLSCCALDTYCLRSFFTFIFSIMRMPYTKNECKKLLFIHMLTATDVRTSKTAKIKKLFYFINAHWRTTMCSDIVGLIYIFYFCCFRRANVCRR